MYLQVGNFCAEGIQGRFSVNGSFRRPEKGLRWRRNYDHIPVNFAEGWSLVICFFHYRPK